LYKGENAYLEEQFRLQLKNEYFGEWISVHLEQYEQRRLQLITVGLSAFVKEWYYIFKKSPGITKAFPAPLDIEPSNQIIENLKRIYNLRYVIKLR
jgi:hypothetical protein